MCELNWSTSNSIHTKSVLSKKIVTNSFAAARVGKIKGNHKHDEQTGGIKIFSDVFFVTMGSSFKEGFISCRECVSQHDVCGMGFYAKISNHNVDLINGSFLWCKNRQNRARTAHHKRFYRFRHCSACILCVRRVTHLFHLAQFLSSSFRFSLSVCPCISNAFSCSDCIEWKENATFGALLKLIQITKWYQSSKCVRVKCGKNGDGDAITHT